MASLSDVTNSPKVASDRKSANNAEYLADHKVHERLASAVTSVLQTDPKPADPILAIADNLAKLSSRAGPYTLMTIQPTFTVKEWALAEPIMAEFVEATKKETGCIYYGWSRCEDKLFCREAYVDAAGCLAHLDNVGALVGKLLESAATLDKIELHGPSEELDKCKGAMDAFGTTYYTIDSGFSCMGKEVASVRSTQTLMSIQPTFTVKDWALAEPIMAEFVEATKKETGCVFYGWTKVGDQLFCREAYLDGPACLAHLDNVGALVGKLLESAATLDKIELHGPSEELDKCKSAMDGFGTTYWTIDSGFQNFAM